MNTGGSAKPTGTLHTQVERNLGDLKLRKPQGWSFKNWLRYRRRELPASVALHLLGHISGVLTIQAALRAQVYRPNYAALAPWQMKTLQDLLKSNYDLMELPRFFGGQTLDYGLISQRLVTNAGVAALVDALGNTFEPENFNFHGYGTGTTAEAAGDTALVTELTTEYVTNNTRPTGTQSEGAANIYRTTATLSPDSGGTLAITEHGVFSQAATGGGTLLDRSVFSAINLVASQDSLQTQYSLTINAGG
jgi:hypothetical protein